MQTRALGRRAFPFYLLFQSRPQHAALLPHNRNLKFSQGYIGILGSIEAAGWIIGALLYRVWFEDMSSKRLLNLSIALGTVTTAAFVFLTGETSAAILNFCSGFAVMVATVATVTLAADYCPPRSEGFTFAVMMSIINY